MRKLIAFIGKMGSGKTTAANYLVNNYGFTSLSFAARLKEIATKACRMQGKDRELLQSLGVMIREDCPTYWVDVIQKKIRNSEQDIVIDDLRFKNEMEMLLKEQFLIVRLDTPRELRLTRMGLSNQINSPSENEKHISETDLDQIEIPLGTNNAGQPEHLYNFLEVVLQNYTKLWSGQEKIVLDILFGPTGPPAWFTSR